MTSPADEEAHQLSYLQKHIENISSLLAEPVEGEGDKSLVLSMEGYEHIGFLIHGDKGSDVVNCHDSVIYLLAPLRYATVYGCSDSTIVLGAAGKAVRVEHCERVHVVAATKRICIANCRECVFFLGINQRPLIVGDNHKLQTEVGIVPTINKWNEPLVLGAVDTHESLSPHPTSAADKQPDSAACVDSDQFTNFLIPNWLAGEVLGSTKANPFPLSDAYMAVQQTSLKNLEETRRSLRETSLEENRKRELTTAFHMHFKDWLYATGNIPQLYCLQGD